MTGPMELSSRSIEEGKPIPKTFAMGMPGDGGPVPAPNRSPHLKWSGAPAGTKSFAVICVDTEAPTKADDVNKADRTVPYDLPRADFSHWILVDLPPTTTELAEGIDSDGLTPKGKAPGPTDHGVRGINNYREWFAGDPAMAGDYGGYDGPWPPFNDERIHRYAFTVYALDVAKLDVPAKFGAPEALRAMEGHVLAKATLKATYAIYPKAR
jgi:Raf kinase inhibitor-like YbhB/YbcL family protein